MSDSVRLHRWQPIKLPHPWDSPGKNTGVGCHFPLQCMKVKSQSEVAQSCPTLSDPMDCCPTGSSFHGILRLLISDSLLYILVTWNSQTHKHLQYIFPQCYLMQPLKKTVWRFLRKLKIELPYDSAIPLLGIYSDKIRIQKDTHTPIFTVALFTIAKTQNNVNVH